MCCSAVSDLDFWGCSAWGVEWAGCHTEWAHAPESSRGSSTPLPNTHTHTLAYTYTQTTSYPPFHFLRFFSCLHPFPLSLLPSFCLRQDSCGHQAVRPVTSVTRLKNHWDHGGGAALLVACAGKGCAEAPSWPSYHWWTIHLCRSFKKILPKSLSYHLSSVINNNEIF